MTASTIDEAFRALSEALLSAEQSARRPLPRPLTFADLPPLPPARARPAIAARPGAPPSDHVDLLNQLARRRLAWLHGATRRELKGLADALTSPSSPPDDVHRLLASPTIRRALWGRLRPRHAWNVAARVWFSRYPPPGIVRTELEELARASERNVPRWARGGLDANALANAMAVSALQEDRPTILRRLELPSWWVPDESWVRRVAFVMAYRAADEDGIRRTLLFADSREKLEVGTPGEVVQETLERLFQHVQRHPLLLPSMASLAQRRLGKVFDERTSQNWVGQELQERRRWLRARLAGEVLDLVFSRLVPDNYELRMQAEGRKTFWRSYSHAVDRMWVLVPPRMKERVEDPALRKLREEMQDAIEIRTLEGQSEQAVVWMVLVGNQPVTVIDGNANTKLRLRSGRHDPPASRLVDYSVHVVHGPLSDYRAEYRKPHVGNWTAEVHTKLAQHNIYPAPR